MPKKRRGKMKLDDFLEIVGGGKKDINILAGNKGQ
jgi:hypothetical protein